MRYWQISCPTSTQPWWDPVVWDCGRVLQHWPLSQLHLGAAWSNATLLCSQFSNSDGQCQNSQGSRNHWTCRVSVCTGTVSSTSNLTKAGQQLRSSTHDGHGPIIDRWKWMGYSRWIQDFWEILCIYLVYTMLHCYDVLWTSSVPENVT